MHYSPALIQLPLVRESSGERIRTPEDIRRVCQDMALLSAEHKIDWTSLAGITTG